MISTRPLNLRRLMYFVKSVEIGSLTQAAEVLYIAQPALSQQLAVLESELKQTLLIRTKRGVAPTPAGAALYRHALLIIRQCEQAQSEVHSVAGDISGKVRIALAQSSMAELLAMPLLHQIRDRHPGIVLDLNQNSGLRQSELVMSGRIDLAILGTSLYTAGIPYGIRFTPVFEEPLYYLSARRDIPEGPIKLADILDDYYILANTEHFLRRIVEDAFQRMNRQPKVVAEICKTSTLGEAIASGLGSSVLPAP
ncbi:LysR family transcriptional regulator [Pseudomonas shirazica]|nr:LysR family transcriptional regulator [Pseudomonas shirazica]